MFSPILRALLWTVAVVAPGGVLLLPWLVARELRPHPVPVRSRLSD